MTPYCVLKQAVNLWSKSSGKYWEVRVIFVMAYIRPLNISSELKDWFTILKAIIGIEDVASGGKKREATSQQPLFR